MPVEAEQYIDACEAAYREGFMAGQHKGMESVVVGWADTQGKLCSALELKGRIVEQLEKSLDAATKDLDNVIRQRDGAIDARNLLLFVLGVVLVVALVVWVTR